MPLPFFKRPNTPEPSTAPPIPEAAPEPSFEEEQVFPTESGALTETPSLAEGEAPVSEELAVEAPESPAEVTESELPQVESPQVVKPLYVGAFLNGELEIVELLERGPINFYRANAGGWGENDWKWVWERAAPTAESVNAPTLPFFAPATRFVSDEREYAVYDWDERDEFVNWRSPANDDTFLELVTPLAQALIALESAGLNPRIEPESMYFEEGVLRYFGFYDASPENEVEGVANLSALSSTLARAHLAPRATLRLDDLWAALPFSVELKAWARGLEDGAFASLQEAASELEQFAAPTNTQTWVQTDVGLERDHNEDGVLSLSLGRASQNGVVHVELLAVADGMGGHEAGEVASQTALDALQRSLLKRLTGNWNDNFEALAQCRELIQDVNAAVVSQNEAPPFASMRSKPGTTLVFALRLGRRLFIGNVGDSRVYRWHPQRGLEALTKDHSYVQDLLDAGKIAPDEAWGHPDSSIITSHIGMSRGLLSDVTLHLVGRAERLFCVSDGVVDTLRDPQIAEVVASANDAKTLCRTLVDAANDAGGIDNISVAALFSE